MVTKAQAGQLLGSYSRCVKERTDAEQLAHSQPDIAQRLVEAATIWATAFRAAFPEITDAEYKLNDNLRQLCENYQLAAAAHSVMLRSRYVEANVIAAVTGLEEVIARLPNNAVLLLSHSKGLTRPQHHVADTESLKKQWAAHVRDLCHRDDFASVTLAAAQPGQLYRPVAHHSRDHIGSEWPAGTPEEQAILATMPPLPPAGIC